MRLSRDEVIRETACIADDMLHAVIDPIIGCRRVWQLSSLTNHEYLSEVNGFVNVVSDWDDDPEHRDGLADDGLGEARAFLKRHPLDN